MSTTQSNLGEIFSSLVPQLGLDPESAEIKAILSNDTLKEVKLSEETANKFKTGFLTMNAAKNNSELNKFFMSKHLSAVDRAVKTSLTNLGVPTELIEEVNGIDSTIKRLEFALPKLQEHFKATYEKPAPDGTKLKEVTDKYSALVAVNQELSKKLETEKSNWLQEREGLEVAFEQKALLSEFTFSDALPREDAEVLISTKLKNGPAIFKKKADGKTGVFQREHPDLEYVTKDNKVPTMKEYLAEVVMPYVKKSGKAGEQTSSTTTTKTIPDGTKVHPNAGLVAEDLKRFEELTKQG